MCGFVGIYNNKLPVDKVNLKQMSLLLSHRGPDDEGEYINKNFGVAHKRLSIIDLSKKNSQPFKSKNGRYVLVYNGEIYNFKEIKKKLIHKYKFYTNSDTEVVLNSFIEYGSNCLKLFNGMFSFAVWDNKHQEIFIARDRFGMKPLYYYCSENTFVFASEIKAILKCNSYQKNLDYYALSEYLTFQNYISDKTLFKNIFLLPQGTFMTVNKKLLVKKFNYFDFDFFNKKSLFKKDDKEKLKHLIQKSIKIQSFADVEINSYLSGGIDSATIVHHAKKYLKNLKTFTIGFDLSNASGIELFFDERKKAENLSFQFKTEHYETILKSGDLESCIDELVYHLEEPRVGQSYPNFYAANLASKFGKVVFSGVGADELFGGYPWRYMDLKKKIKFDEFVNLYFKRWERMPGDKLINNNYCPIKINDRKEYKFELFKNILKKNYSKFVTPDDAINHSLYFEAKTFLNSLLIVEDKISMSRSLETRAPFMENNLANFAMKIPNKYLFLETTKYTNENSLKKYDQSIKGKIILRDALNSILPTSFTKDRKQGFSAPDQSWFRGESIDYVKSQLNFLPNYLDKTKAFELFDLHVNKKKNLRLIIWSMLYLIKFSKIFKMNK